ncbi:hypothetical protein G7046_g1746 [Stylonectria norvegica]|nr:hypothetical protein G7046_g1746 [Stylonectria norvegica]
MSSGNADFYVRPEYIKRGGWTNWDDGGKITVTKSAADLLMIFIGIFFVFMEAGLWSLIAFALFSWRRSRNSTKVGNPPLKKSKDRNALWHQQQAVLRNAGDDRTVGITYISLWLSYGWRSLGVVLRTWPVVLMALGSFAVFLIALPFITAYLMLDGQGNEVLIESPLCGWWQTSFEDDVVVASTELTNRTREAVQYADNCYESSAPSDLCDNFLAKRKLTWTGWHNTECPFAQGVCLGDKHFPAFQMETMLLDSHQDFGMNSPKSGRFSLQKTTTCAPLDVEAWSKVVDGTLEGENITEVHFGATTTDDYTFAVSNLQFLAAPDYNLVAYTSYVANESATGPVGTFIPIKQLKRADADVSVVFLNNNLISIAGINGPCRDPFFSATKRQSATFPDWYRPDHAITAIGCADQYALHDPVTNAWSSQTGMLMLGSDIDKSWGLSPRQVTAMNTLRWIIGKAGATGALVEAIGSDVLRAKKYPGVFNYFQNPLPNDQWKREVGYWFNIALASLQLQLVSIATGPAETQGMTNALPALSTGSKAYIEGLACHSQKIHSNGFKNFHRDGFIALGVVGGLLVLAPWLLIQCALLWGRRRRKAFALEWFSYGHLQLLRMANEGVGVEGWRDCDAEMPLLTNRHELLATLDTGFATGGQPHPRLRPPRAVAIVPVVAPVATGQGGEVSSDEATDGEEQSVSGETTPQAYVGTGHSIPMVTLQPQNGIQTTPGRNARNYPRP